VSPRDDLRELAAFGNVGVKEANHFDPRANRFDATCRLRVEGVKLTAYANEAFLLCDLSVDVPIVLALGRPDRHLVGADVPIVGVNQAKAYSSTADLAEATVFLAAPEALAKIAALALEDDEQVIVAKNRSSFLMRPGGLEADLRRLSILIALLKLAAATEGNGDPHASDPQKLTPLAGVSSDTLTLLAQWAISDDDEREHVIGLAENDTLTALTQFLADHGALLDERIGELETTDPDGAALWGAVAETCAEARAELERRKTD
jgi:hypothetical protein